MKTQNDELNPDLNTELNDEVNAEVNTDLPDEALEDVAGGDVLDTINRGIDKIIQSLGW